MPVRRGVRRAAAGPRSPAARARRSSCGEGAGRPRGTSASSRRPRRSHSSPENSARTSSTNAEGSAGSPSSSDERKERNRTSSGRDRRIQQILAAREHVLVPRQHKPAGTGEARARGVVEERLGNRVPGERALLEAADEDGAEGGYGSRADRRPAPRPPRRARAPARRPALRGCRTASRQARVGCRQAAQLARGGAQRGGGAGVGGLVLVEHGRRAQVRSGPDRVGLRNDRVEERLGPPRPRPRACRAPPGGPRAHRARRVSAARGSPAATSTSGSSAAARAPGRSSAEPACRAGRAWSGLGRS